MGLTAEKTLIVGGGVLALGVMLYAWSRGATGVVRDVVGGVSTGVVHGVSDAVGLPVPERSKCDQAKEQGRTLDASFYCPAGEFVGYLFK